MDNDGDMDILVVNQTPTMLYPVESRTKLFRNDAQRGNWVKIKLKGVQAEANGIGSRIEIIVDGKKMIREVDGGGSSHLSQNSTIVHFGIGNAKKIDQIIVRWTGGKEQILLNQRINTLIQITESPDEVSFSYYWAGLALLILFILGYWLYKRKE
jgi:enediyne biosynthesis protein E4